MTMLLLLSTLLLSTCVKQHAVYDKVDLIEVNHYHDESGRHVFDQLIFYDWHAGQNRFHVRAWRLIKEPGQTPMRDHDDKVWRVIWHDAGVLRHVEASSHRETWTQFDPELANRSYLPQDQRKDLSQPRSLSRRSP
ncbi:hypothetical protein SH139x_000766 [Planctomycetaceae bacterium SH139]